MGIDQPDVKATLFEHFKEGNPVDAGRLHHHGRNLTLSQPLGEGVEISRQRPKALHRLRIAITGHGHPMVCWPHINPSGIAMHLLERRCVRLARATLTLLPSTWTTCCPCHRDLLPHDEPLRHQVQGRT